MSTLGDVLGGIRQVLSLDDRVTKLQTDLDVMATDVKSIDRRLSRLEGLFEMAMYQEQRRIDRD